MREFLHQDEYIIQSAPGAIDIGTLDILWMPGNLRLSNKRLIFEHQERIHFATLHEDVVDVKLEVRKWVLPHTKQLRISYRARPGDSIRVAYIVLKSPVRWQKLIKDRMTLALFKE